VPSASATRRTRCTGAILATINVTPLHIGCQTINPVDKVRDLGVTIDDELTMDACRKRRPQLFLPASTTTQRPAIPDNRRPAHPGQRLHSQSS